MNFNEDKFLKSEAKYPRFIVKSVKVAIPFYDKEYAIAWQKQVCKDIGIVTEIIDLTNYDWIKNPNGIKFHKQS